MIIKIITWINLALLLLHEMDAVRTSEWKMMAFVNRLESIRAEALFIALHFIMFLAVFFMLEFFPLILFWATSLFPLFHHGLHILFRNHPENRLNNPFSLSIIRLMTLSGAAGIIYGLISNY